MAAAQLLQKTYDCLACKAPIKLARKDDGSGWNKYNLDGSPHLHPTKKNQQQQPPQQQQQQVETSIEDPAKEVAAIRAQLLVLVSRLDRIEQQMMMKH